VAAPGHVPAEVVALAHRLGIEEPQYGGSVLLRQTGRLRSDAKARWMRFKARQHIAVDRCGFAWRAGVGPLGLIHVEDALDGATPIGRVAALGIIPLARSEYSVPLLKGELMRYLAELPWAPDAILANSELQWEAQGEGRLAVSAKIDTIRATVIFHLDETGLPVRVEGRRPRQEGGVFHEREWHGEFGDFRTIEGRLVPHVGRVSWRIEAERVDVWHGRLVAWSISGPKR